MHPADSDLFGLIIGKGKNNLESFCLEPKPRLIPLHTGKTLPVELVDIETKILNKILQLLEIILGFLKLLLD